MATVPTDRPLAASGADGVARAALLGIAGGMRTTAPLATLATRGRIARGPGRYAIFAATAAELVADKSPEVADRTGPAGLPGRLATSAFAGRTLGGWPGLAAGLLGAGIGTFTSFRLRAQGADALGITEPVVAALEDVAALGLGALATAGLEEPDAAEPTDAGTAEDERPSVIASVARGLAAGAIGTVAMTAGQLAYYQLTGGELSDEPARAGNKVLKAVFGTKVERRNTTAFTWFMHGAYGTGWGAAYGLAAGAAGAQRPPLAGTGAAFGLGVWGASLVELPALGEAPPPWQQPLSGLAIDASFHLLYGLSTAAAYRALGGAR